MKYVDEFRNKELVATLAEKIRKSVSRDYTFMEVCGGHTAAIHRFGIPELLPAGIRLISGPGCPVCVTATDFIDKAIEYSKMSDIIICTFGDLLKVPGSVSSLEKGKAAGADVRIILSAIDGLEFARKNPEKKVIFLGIGFETTAPGTAVTIKQAAKEKITNFFLLCAHKVMPPAMEAIIRNGVRFDGFICPGHVATITGSSIFGFIPEQFNLGCVIAGFEPVDLLQSILMLIRQVNDNAPVVEIQYSRAVRPDGNPIARKFISEVFEPDSVTWRGLGMIPLSGLKMRKNFEMFDIEKRIQLDLNFTKDNELCICGKILRGINTPFDCPLFATVCYPENPLGACMVSGEGSCNTWYKYKKAK
jgi:hydrogenase expression/formation protein HypD